MMGFFDYFISRGDLVNAANQNNASLVDRYLIAHPNPDSDVKEYLILILTRCADDGNLEMVRTLLKHGINPYARNGADDTALLRAARNNHTAVMQALLEHGAKVDTQDPTFGDTALMWACIRKNYDAIRLLLQHGANPNISDTTSANTPLIIACTNGDADAVRLLLRHGADPDRKDLFGYDAYFYSSDFTFSAKNPEVFDLVKNASVKHRNDDKQSKQTLSPVSIFKPKKKKPKAKRQAARPVQKVG